MKLMSLFLCSLGATLSLFSFQATAAPMYGVFMVSKGSVKIETAAKKISDAKVGSKVYEGDKIITGVDSRAKVVMSDRNVINISPDTEIKIAQYQNDEATGKKNVELDLLKGKVRNNVEQKYDDENKFQVKTLTAVAGVRGTQFVVGFDPGSRVTSVVTFKGAVSFATINAQGNIIGAPVMVNKGQQSSAGPDVAPDRPKAMPKDEAKKADAESSASKDQPAKNRDVASEGPVKPEAPASAGTMIDKKDTDSKIATEIKDIRSPVVAPPPVVPRLPSTTTNDIVKDIIRDTAGKTKVIVRPTK